MLRVAYFADDAWAVAALRRLHAHPHADVVLVIERATPTSDDAATAARRLGLPLTRTADVNSPGFAGDHAQHRHLGVSHSYDQVFRGP